MPSTFPRKKEIPNREKALQYLLRLSTRFGPGSGREGISLSLPPHTRFPSFSLNFDFFLIGVERKRKTYMGKGKRNTLGWSLQLGSGLVFLYIWNLEHFLFQAKEHVPGSPSALEHRQSEGSVWLCKTVQSERFMHFDKGTFAGGVYYFCQIKNIENSIMKFSFHFNEI